MSAETLYDALHAAITEQLELDDPLSSFEIIGAIEQVKFDVQMQLAVDDEDEEDTEE